jgi:cytosine/uracil/thiamine/allantoin permease
VLSAIIPGWRDLLTRGFDGHTGSAWISFLLLWALSVAIVDRGVNLLRHVENRAAPFALVMTAALLCGRSARWAASVRCSATDLGRSTTSAGCRR